MNLVETSTDRTDNVNGNQSFPRLKNFNLGRNCLFLALVAQFNIFILKF